MNVSKWLKVYALLEVAELKELLGDSCLYNVSEVLTNPGALIDNNRFFAAYAAYVESLKTGKKPVIDRHLFSAAISKEPVPICDLGKGRFIAKPDKPVIQMQPHAFVIAGGKCLSMVHGEESISWGLQFAYPQIAMDAAGHLEKTLRTTENGALFLSLQKWMRENTKPAKLTIDGKQMNVSIRLGKQWTGRLPHD